jgi:hypothetical protein
MSSASPICAPGFWRCSFRFCAGYKARMKRPRPTTRTAPGTQMPIATLTPVARRRWRRCVGCGCVDGVESVLWGSGIARPFTLATWSRARYMSVEKEDMMLARSFRERCAICLERLDECVEKQRQRQSVANLSFTVRSQPGQPHRHTHTTGFIKLLASRFRRPE